MPPGVADNPDGGGGGAPAAQLSRLLVGGAPAPRPAAASSTPPTVLPRGRLLGLLLARREEVEAGAWLRAADRSDDMVCVACLLPLFLIPVVNTLPYLFDLILDLYELARNQRKEWQNNKEEGVVF